MNVLGLHLFLISVAVDVLLEGLHPLKGLFTVNAVDENKAICKSVVVSRKLHPIPEPAGVIEANLLSSATVSFYGADVDILQGLHGL